MYSIVVHRRAAKALKEIPGAHLVKFYDLIECLKTNPVPWKVFDLKKIEGMEDTFRIRIGDYRVIYFIEKKEKAIHILKIELRSRAY